MLNFLSLLNSLSCNEDSCILILWESEKCSLVSVAKDGGQQKCRLHGSVLCETNPEDKKSLPKKQPALTSLIGAAQCEEAAKVTTGNSFSFESLILLGSSLRPVEAASIHCQPRSTSREVTAYKKCRYLHWQKRSNHMIDQHHPHLCKLFSLPPSYTAICVKSTLNLIDNELAHWVV